MTAPTFRRAALAAAALAAALFAAAPAQAQSSCQEDFTRITGKREALIKQLNAATRGGKAKLDPAVACPRLQSLAAVERELVAYMEKNKEWCGIPDDALENARKGSGRTAGIAGQACRVATQMKRARAQAEAQARNGGGGPQVQRLPTGPL
ncbi:MAG: hypothetical protein JNK46_20645 [Methylobacteriaceae bacterium]|nr:hypothetical protein [Methylobacteriaceae bacterium]